MKEGLYREGTIKVWSLMATIFGVEIMVVGIFLLCLYYGGIDLISSQNPVWVAPSLVEAWIVTGVGILLSYLGMGSIKFPKVRG